MIIRDAAGVSEECEVMLQRVLTSVVGLAVFFFIVFSNVMVLNSAVVILIFGMLYEMYKAINVPKAVWIAGGAGTIVLMAGLFLNAAVPAVLILITFFLLLSVFLHGKVGYEKIYTTGFVTLYLVLFMSTILQTRAEFGMGALMLIFLCAWMTDTGAYFSGYFFGKHKLIPKVSPKKTVEGAIGGVVWCVLSCALYQFIITKCGIGIPGMQGYLRIMLLGGGASILSQFGDLIASALKRDCGVKDFGTIFPGHGGILDRFDSVVFIAPFIFYFLKLVI